MREDMARYYDEVQRFDRHVGEVVTALKEEGVYENTCIIVMADNGRPFPRCKMRLLDSGINTPLIIRCPRFLAKGVVSDSLVSVLDLAPTILEWAGLEASETFQGLSLKPVLENPEAEIRQYVFAEHNWHLQAGHERMVHHGDFVYIRNAYPNVAQVCQIERECPHAELVQRDKEGKTTMAQRDPILVPRPAEELFNVAQDYHQIHNLAEKPEYHEVLNRLRAVMDSWIERTGDTTPIGGYKKDEPPFISGKARGAEKINDPGPR